MTSEFKTHRPLVCGNDWMIVSGSPLASQAGAQILNAGGTAADAAIAANSVLSVVRPHMNGPGGDLFALFYTENTGRVDVLNASGRSPATAGIQALKHKGRKAVPAKGILSATVPGAVQGWWDLHQRYGSMPFESLFRPAVDLAEKGIAVYPELSDMIRMESNSLKQNPDAVSIFFKDGNPLQPGERLIQKDLARSLASIAQKGPGEFYQGGIAKALVKFSEENDGFFTIEDLKHHTSVWSNPVEADYRGFTLFTAPPNSQGISWLIMANILNSFNFINFSHNSADPIHLMVEAKKRAFAVRDRHVCDPDVRPAPIRTLLSQDLTQALIRTLDMKKAALNFFPPEFQSLGEDTVYLAAVDSQGNAVSLIQSLYEGFGSGTVIPGTGIFLHNRGKDFQMEQAHPNCLGPKKRPFHTLSPAMILKNGKLAFVLGTPGADGQPQTLMQVTSNLIDFGADPQEAVEAPRWRSNPDGSLIVESRIPVLVLEELRARGHRIDLKAEFDMICGGAQVIRIDRDNGFLFAGADPRRQAYAIGM